MNLCPSMMCANYGCLKEEVDALEKAGADIFHLDLMDGRFVPNFAMGIQDIRFISTYSHILTEVHLMIEHPFNYISLLKECGVDIVYIHPESEYHPITTLQKIKEMEMESGIVIGPGTSVPTVLELLNVTDRVLVMGVNPGQAGQMYLQYAEEKIERLVELQKTYNFSIGMDGACNIDRIVRLSRIGVENFVLGTAGLFFDGVDYNSQISLIRRRASGIDSQ